MDIALIWIMAACLMWIIGLLWILWSLDSNLRSKSEGRGEATSSSSSTRICCPPERPRDNRPNSHKGCRATHGRVASHLEA